MSKTIHRNAMWMSIGQATRLGVQAAYFTLIARSLGISKYGAFVGVVALVGIFYPFGSLGRGNILVKSVSRDRASFRVRWGEALSTTGLCGPFLVTLVIFSSRYILPSTIPTRVVFLVAFADIVGLNLITIAGQAFQAFEQLHWTAAINVMSTASRLIAGLILYSFQHSPSVLQWGYIYFTSTLLVAFGACCLVSIRLGSPTLRIAHSWGDVTEGGLFSVSLAAQTAYNDIDKTMLVRLSTLSASGVYGAAYRIIDVSFAPVSALLYASYPGMFREGDAGLSSSLAYAKPILLRAVGYASVMACAILLGAGAVPYILGAQYRDTAEALRWLAPLPILKALHYFISDSLSGAGYQGLRSLIQVGVAVFNILINLWLIPRYSWRGASWSSILSDGILVAAVAAGAMVLVRRERSRAVLIC